MTGNPWKLTGRIYWKNDPKFIEFDRILYDEYFTFEEIWSFSQLNYKIKFLDEEKSISNIIKLDIKNKWSELSKKWNNEEIQYHSHDENKIIGFSALTFLCASLPFDKIKNPEIFTEFQISKMNVIYNYYNFPKYINLKGSCDLTEIGPIYLPTFMEWLDDKLDSASWWWSYQIYEYQNNMNPIV